MSQTATDAVQGLIRLNIDSSQGFTTSAELIDNVMLADSFRDYAEKRSENAEELKASVAYNGESPNQSGSTAGTLHRWWLNIRGRVTGGNEHSVLAEAERGEDSIKKAYESAIKETAGSPIAELLAKQYSGVKSTHDRIRDMRDAYQAASK